MADKLGPSSGEITRERDIGGGVRESLLLIVGVLRQDRSGKLALFAYNPKTTSDFSRAGNEGRLLLSDSGDLQIQRGRNRLLVIDLPDFFALRLDAASIADLEVAAAALEKARGQKYVAPLPRPGAEAPLIPTTERLDKQDYQEILWPIIQRYNGSQSRRAREVVKRRLGELKGKSEGSITEKARLLEGDFHDLAINGSDSVFARHYPSLTLIDFKELYWILYGKWV